MILGELTKNKFEKIVISKEKFRGYPLVNIRVYFRLHEADDWRPGRKGIAIREDLFPGFLSILEKIKIGGKKNGKGKTLNTRGSKSDFTDTSRVE